ncbi:10143_t:CDS:2 [Gigaspora margarita]|uniref:10143_t:CDS:1 n=1 Tax=Gigaspora margarita TaxID=4874 RepID=A0ABN7VAS0_GIGMA|nr:10143_t:CDS:2 [Gigaspora margarita]
MTFQTEPVFKGHYIITIFLAGVGWIVLLGGAGAITAFYDDVVGSYNKLLSSSSSVGSKLGSQINSQVNSQMNGVFAALCGTSIIALFPDLSSKFNALIAGLSILAIVNIIWIIIIGSEDDSTLVKTIDSYYDKKNKNDSTGTRFAPQPTSTYTSDA